MKKITFLTLVIVILLAIGIKTGYFSTKTAEPLESTKVKVISEESLIINAVETASPSVVTIQIAKNTPSNQTYLFDPFNPFSPFEIEDNKGQIIEQSIGSGFIVKENGLIVTNKHVVDETEAKYKVITNDGKVYEVKQIWRDSLNDLAIVKIDAKDLSPLELANSDKLKLGQIAIAIGTPLGEFRNTVTSGIISGLGRGIVAGSPYESFVERLDNVIQTDAAINPGNSGGPLLNSLGQVIGINTAVSQSGQNIGFAIPVNVVSELLQNYLQSGNKISRPFLGIRYKILDKETAVLNDLVQGAYILEVIEGSSAYKAGLQKGQVIIKIDGHNITKENDINNLVKQKKVGDSLNIEFWDGNSKRKLDIVLGEFE